jgi:hypothetical protein
MSVELVPMLGGDETVTGALGGSTAAWGGVLDGTGCAALGATARCFFAAFLVSTWSGGNEAAGCCAMATDPHPIPYDTAALTMAATDRDPLLLI